MIFNSLGSSYNFEFVLKTLFVSNSKKNKLDLINFLNKKYDGETILLYKGREAIKLSIDLLKLEKGSKVGITGLTCYAVYKAVVDTGCVPVYIDIEKSTLNFSLSEVKKHKDLKVLIIQNTLGNPCDVLKIKKYCLENKIILIEDLAHSIGSIYENGKEVGSYGDFVVLSFGQDKIIDSVSGGALVVKNHNYTNFQNNPPLEKVSLRMQLKDRLYALFTFKIRKTYPLGLGKVLHFILKRMDILSRPVDGSGGIVLHDLPNWYCDLVNFQFSKLESNLKHRRKIIDIYKNKLSKNNSLFSLRFPLLVKDRKKMIEYLKQKGIYISDIWYDAPIAPIRYLKITNYKNGECPVSEKVSKEIINLPTHINVSGKDAEKISSLIIKWQNTQQ